MHDELPSSESDDGSYDSDDMERGNYEEEYVGPEIDYDKAEEHWHLNLAGKKFGHVRPSVLGSTVVECGHNFGAGVFHFPPCLLLCKEAFQWSF